VGNTQENLQSAFAGESQANRKYLFFADKAEKEGHSQIARLFRAVAEAKTVHAYNNLEAMGGMGSTKDNLMAAISGEEYEFKEMYPDFTRQAASEKNMEARTSFEYAIGVEKIHHDLYQKALKDLEAGEQLKDEPYFICPVCGYTVAGEAPKHCPMCGAPGSQFKRVE